MKKFIMVLSLVLVFSFTGCSIDNSPIEERNFITTDDLISTKDLNKLISDYLKEYVGSIAGDNAKVFESHKIIGTEVDDDTILAYITSAVDSYKVKNNKAYSSTGGDFTGIVYLQKDNEQYKVVKSDFPAESSACKALFPRKLLKELESISYDWLRKDANNQAEEYFNKNNINMIEN